MNRIGIPRNQVGVLSNRGRENHLSLCGNLGTPYCGDVNVMSVRCDRWRCCPHFRLYKGHHWFHSPQCWVVRSNEETRERVTGVLTDINRNIKQNYVTAITEAETWSCFLVSVEHIIIGFILSLKAQCNAYCLDRSKYIWLKSNQKHFKRFVNSLGAIFF